MTVQLVPLSSAEYDAWRERTRERLIRLRRDSGYSAGDDAAAQADQYLDQLLPEGLQTSTAHLLRLVDDAGDELGVLWAGASATRMFLVDLSFTRPPTDAENDQLMAGVVALAGRLGVASMSMAVFPQDAEGHRFLEGRGFSASSIQMLLDPIPARDATIDIAVEPMSAERFRRFDTESQEAFAVDLVASGRYDLEGARAESKRQFAAELPQGLATPGHALFAAEADGVEVGILWIGMRERAGRPHAFVLDVEVAADQRRRGFGRQMMLAAEREASRRGADSIGLHVFGFNDGAVSLYESLGYRRTEELFLREL